MTKLEAKEKPNLLKKKKQSPINKVEKQHSKDILDADEAEKAREQYSKELSKLKE